MSTTANDGEAVKSSKSYQKKCRLSKLPQATCHQKVWRASTDGTALPIVGPDCGHPVSVVQTHLPCETLRTRSTAAQYASLAAPLSIEAPSKYAYASFPRKSEASITAVLAESTQAVQVSTCPTCLLPAPRALVSHCQLVSGRRLAKVARVQCSICNCGRKAQEQY